MIIHLKCLPPSVTAQQKRVRVIGGKPVFFHGASMQRERQTWAALLAPFVPAVPIQGAIKLTIIGIWPHPKSARKADQSRVLPKTTKPDCSNFAKEIEDQLARMRFMDDDARVSTLHLEKWCGPTDDVGIHIAIEPA